MSETKLNCWEYLQCGREPGGSKVEELGVCPAAEAVDFDGINQGQKAGRFCWAVDETYCQGLIQEKIADKALSCMNCAFYQLVVHEERQRGFILHPKQLLK